MKFECPWPKPCGGGGVPSKEGNLGRLVLSWKLIHCLLRIDHKI